MERNIAWLPSVTWMVLLSSLNLVYILSYVFLICYLTLGFWHLLFRLRAVHCRVSTVDSYHMSHEQYADRLRQNTRLWFACGTRHYINLFWLIDWHHFDGHFWGKSGLTGCPSLDSQSPVCLVLSILARQAETLHTRLLKVGRWGWPPHAVLGLYPTLLCLPPS